MKLKECLVKLNEKLYGLELQTRRLSSLLSEFCATSKGGSCVISGRRQSGKSSVLDLLLRDFSDEEVIYEDGDLYASGAVQSLKKLDERGLLRDDFAKHSRDKEDLKKRFIIIIDHFEKFTSKKSQSLLYTLLNGTQHLPWLVILVGSTQDCVSVPPLEKRVYSRLSKTIISFNQRVNEIEVLDAFNTFLNCVTDCDELSRICDVPRDSWERVVRRFYRRCEGIGSLKRLVALFALARPTRGVTLAESPIDTLEFCANCLCPENDAINILNALPLRQMCLLWCFIRLQQSMHLFELLCRDIIFAYKHFVNTYSVSSLDVESCILYKDIEELIALCIITARGGPSTDVGELQFRKVALNVEDEALIFSFKSRNLPLEVAQWLHIV